MMLRCSVSCVLTSVLMLWFSAPALGQGDADTALDDIDLSMMQSAFEAFEAEDFAMAESLFRGALERKASNYAYASLGLSIFLQGRCAGAGIAYELARRAPAVAEPDPQTLAERLDLYQGRLEETCQPTPLTCSLEETALRIDGHDPMPCPPGGVIWLTPGTHTIAASYADQREQVTLEAGQTQAVSFIFEPLPEPEPAPEVRAGWPWGVTSYAVMGLGVATLGAALAVDRLVVAPAHEAALEAADDADSATFVREGETFERRRGAVIGLTLAGGALLAGGVAMFALTFESDGEVEQPPQSGRQPWPTPWVSDRAAGLSWGSSW